MASAQATQTPPSRTARPSITAFHSLANLAMLGLEAYSIRLRLADWRRFPPQSLKKSVGVIRLRRKEISQTGQLECCSMGEFTEWRTRLPGGKRDLFGCVEMFKKGVFKRTGERSVTHYNIQVEEVATGPAIHIGRTNKAIDTINYERFGMQGITVLLIDLNALA